MALYPSVGVGCAPAGLFIDAAQIFGNNAFIFLLFMPDRPFGPIHHFIGTDHPITAQVQETAKR
jgi:hypothetical protein